MNQLSYIAMPGVRVRDCPVNVSRIIEVVTRHTGIHHDIMKKKTRKREVVYARQLCIWLIAHYRLLTLEATGKLFGGRDHTTCIHSKQKINDLMFSDPVVKEDVQNFIIKLGK
jgi:chromosomal replication initiator protein